MVFACCYDFYFIKMGSANKIAGGVVWSMVVNLINGFYGFISVPLLINHFGKGEYGLIGLAMSINVYMQLMDMGFNNTNLRYYANWLTNKENNKVKTLFQSSLAFYGSIGFLNAIILVALSFFSAQLFHLTPDQDIILKKLLYILAVSALISWYSSCFDQLIRATENVAWIQKRTVIPKLTMIVVLFVTIWCNLSIEWFFFLTTFAAFIILPMSIGKIKKEVAFISFIPKFNWPILKETLPYAINIFSFSIFQFSYNNLMPVIVGIRGAVESVADYRILYGITGAVAVFANVFMGALMPSTVKAVAADNKDAYYRIAYDATKYISMVLAFCAFGMMTIGQELMTVYVGSEYLYLVPWLYIWLFLTMTNHNQALSTIALAGTKIRPITYSSAIASIAGLIVAWFMVPHFQIGGVVFGLITYNLIQQLFWYFIYWPKFLNVDSKHVFVYSLLPYLMLGFIIYVILNIISIPIQNTWGLLIVKGLVFALVYGTIIIIILNRNDKEFLKSLIKKKN